MYARNITVSLLCQNSDFFSELREKALEGAFLDALECF